MDSVVNSLRKKHKVVVIDDEYFTHPENTNVIIMPVEEYAFPAGRYLALNPEDPLGLFQRPEGRRFTLKDALKTLVASLVAEAVREYLIKIAA